MKSHIRSLGALAVATVVIGLALYRSQAMAEPAALGSAEARHIAETWASSYTAATIGASNPDIRFSEMTLMDLHHVANARDIASSPFTRYTSTTPRDVWVGYWQQEEVFDATNSVTGVAYVAVVLDDESGKVLAAGAGIAPPAAPGPRLVDPAVAERP